MPHEECLYGYNIWYNINYIIDLALVTFNNNGHNKLNTALRDGIEGLIIKFSSLKWSDFVIG